MSNTPKIRFKGFTDDWEQRKLDDVMSCVTDYVAAGSFADIRNNVTYLSEPGYAQLVRTVDLKKKFTNMDNIFVDKNAFDYLWRVNLNEDCIVLPNIGANIGEVYYVEPSELPQENNVLGPNAILLKTEEDRYFVFTSLTTDGFQSQLFENVGSSGQPKFNKTELKNINLWLPSSEEQKKIGNAFRNLDNLITLHQRKCDETKELKKYMLQKMFPKNGETKPEIRFEGFTDDWEQRKLLDLLSQPVSDGPHETPDLVEEGIPFISVDAIVDNKIDFNRKRGYITEEYDLECRKKYSPQRDDVYLVKSGATVGKVAIVETDERFNIWSPLAAMRTNKELMLPNYLYFYLQLKDVQDEIYEKSIGGTQPNLSMRVLEQFNIRVPHIDEQEKISDALNNLDNLITLHQRKCDNLKELKKYMLQNMFPQKD